MRQAKDRASTWMIEHYGASLLHLFGVHGFRHWKPLQNVQTYPKQTPDGLIELTWDDRTAPIPVLIEIESYADQSSLDETFEDLAIVFLNRGVIPDIFTLILAPKGNYRLPNEQRRVSALGTTELIGKWKVIELWTLSAESLLEQNDVGIIPWVPLTQSNLPPEVLLQTCKERIEQQASPKDRDSLFIVTKLLASMRYNDSTLLNLIGATPMIMETPFAKEMLALNTRMTKQNAILTILRVRVRANPPQDLVAQVKSITDLDRLEFLIGAASETTSFESFRDLLNQENQITIE